MMQARGQRLAERFNLMGAWKPWWEDLSNETLRISPVDYFVEKCPDPCIDEGFAKHSWALLDVASAGPQ